MSSRADAGDRTDVPGYELLGILGRGGMGIVYRARQVKLDRIVALKMVIAGGRADPEEIARFRTEGEAVARLQHPNVVQIYEVGDCHGEPYFSLEFCPGGSLAQKLAGTPLPPDEAARVVEPLARGMDAAHRRSIIHRDLKPANVLLTADGTPKVTDFGLAKKLDADSGHTQTGVVMGTPSYMAPEQASGNTAALGPPTDVWALGAILYECLTGRPPFRGTSAMNTVAQVLNEEPVAPSRLNSQVPRDLETICLKCLTKGPAGRYATAAALADDLGRFLRREPVLARPTPAWERAAKWARRSPAKAVAVAATAGLTVAAFLALYAGFASARKDAELARRDADEQQRKLSESTHRDDQRGQAEAAFGGAERAAAAGRWAEVEAKAGEALAILSGDPTLAQSALRGPAEQYRDRARRELASAAARADAADRLGRLERHLADAVFHRTLLTGLRADDALGRVRRAAADGLTLFGVRVEGDGPLAADPAAFEPAQVERAAAACAELLTLEADALSQPRLDELAADWHARLREALRRLDRAERLAPVTHAGLRRRADAIDRLGDADAAGRARQRADETALATATDFFLSGLAHFDAGDFPAARRDLAAAQRRQPDHFGAQYVLATCFIQEQDWRAARDALTACSRLRPDFAWAYLLRGLAESEAKNYPAADADFARALDGRPDPLVAYVAHVNRGASLVRRGEWAAAGADLRRAVEIDPRPFAAYVNLAHLEKERGEPAAAVGHLDRALEHNPNAAALYHERGRLRVQLGDADGAKADFRNAVRWAPTVGPRSSLVADLLDLGRLLRQGGDHAAALGAYDAALRARPDEASAHRLRAEVLLALGRPREAGEALDRYLDAARQAGPGRRPEPPRDVANGHLARGLIHFDAAGELRSAIDQYTLSLQVERTPAALRQRGWTYLLANAAALALADFEEALGLKATDGDALLGRADARVRLGRVAEAVADADAGLSASPAESLPAYRAARVYAQAAGRLLDGARPDAQAAMRYQERAAALLRQAVERKPAGERTKFWRGVVQADPTLAVLRRAAAFAPLAREYGGLPGG